MCYAGSHSDIKLSNLIRTGCGQMGSHTSELDPVLITNDSLDLFFFKILLNYHRGNLAVFLTKCINVKKVDNIHTA